MLSFVLHQPLPLILEKQLI